MLALCPKKQKFKILRSEAGRSNYNLKIRLKIDVSQNYAHVEKTPQPLILQIFPFCKFFLTLMHLYFQEKKTDLNLLE